MFEAYGKAVIDERTKPRRQAELATYLRQEYGSGTEPGWLLAEANGARRSGVPPKANGGILRALGEAVRALLPRNGNGRKAKAGRS